MANPRVAKFCDAVKCSLDNIGEIVWQIALIRHVLLSTILQILYFRHKLSGACRTNA